MDSRLVFRPRPHVLKPARTPSGSPRVPTGHGTCLPRGPFASSEGEKGVGGAATSVKATWGAPMGQKRRWRSMGAPVPQTDTGGVV